MGQAARGSIDVVVIKNVPGSQFDKQEVWIDKINGVNCYLVGERGNGSSPGISCLKVK